MVPNAVPLIRASEIRTMSLTPARKSLLGIAGFRHARRALRSGVAQHQHVVGRDLQRRIVDPQRHVFDGFKHHRAAGVLQQLWCRRRLLDDGAAWREVAVQHGHRALFLDRIVARANDILSRHVFGARDHLAQRRTRDGFSIEIDEIAELCHQFRHATGMMEVLHVMRA
jgi:hypothetical protein